MVCFKINGYSMQYYNPLLFKIIRLCFVFIHSKFLRLSIKKNNWTP